MPGPLDGFRILDLTAVVSGPYATMILADQSADVIKVEPQGRGDFTRSAGNRSGGLSASFLNNNRNKRSITIDLKSEDGVALLKRLAADCDVFVQNFRPGVVERMGLGEDAIRAASPNIDQRLRRDRPLRRQAGLRSLDPGAVGPRLGTGRIGRRTAPPSAHYPARQTHRHHR